MKSINRSLLVRAPAFLTVVLSCLCLSNCHLGPEGDAILYVTGNIYDSTSGEPIDGAWVDFHDTLSSPMAITDSAGWFEIIPFVAPPQIVRIFFGMEGYSTRDTTLLITVKAMRFDSLKIYLERD